MDPLLLHLRKHCQELMPSMDINLVTSLARILEVRDDREVWGRGRCVFLFVSCVPGGRVRLSNCVFPKRSRISPFFTLFPSPFPQQAALHPRNGLDLAQPLDDQSRISIQYAFAYSAVWGLGGNLAR